jgi:hypothetical protein
MEPHEPITGEGLGLGGGTNLFRDIFWPLMLAALVFGLTGIPYAIGFFHTPQGMVFGGILEWIEDEDMYFSFIRQAADGHFLFANRLTTLDHTPVYFNPQWWLVGRIMAWLGGSSAWAYQVWRAAGAVSVIFGFSALTKVVLRDQRQRLIAMLMCAFGGGFSWISAVLKRLDPDLLRSSAELSDRLGIETRTGMHPFNQILGNPNFSLPLGLLLLSFAWYVRGEITGGRRCYAIATALAFIEGAMRPYDLITIYTVIPLFLLIEFVVTRDPQIHRLAWRALPIVTTAPLLLYFIYIFKFHHVFKYWGSQGHSMVIPVHWHLLNLGLGGGLVAVRLCLLRTYPIRTSAERLLSAWIIIVFFFAHAHKLPMFHSMPYTFQLVSTTMPPVILLGVVVLDPARWARSERGVAAWPLFIAAFLIANSASSIRLVENYSKSVYNNQSFYIPYSLIETTRYINKNLKINHDIVLCVRETGHTLARYAPVRVVVGHWSVTPHGREIETRVERFYRSDMTVREREEFLKEFGVTWIYWGSSETKLGAPPREAIPGFETRLINPDIVLYSAKNLSQ